ncbi:hypothetical protein ACVWW3_004624 [Bradyrhizobium sp. LM2.9]
MPEFHRRLPCVGQRTNLVQPYLSMSHSREGDAPMNKALITAVVMLASVPASAAAQERAGAAALGAVSGAVVLGPIGAVAGRGGRLYRRTCNRPVLGRERFTLGETSATAASRGVPRGGDRGSAAHTRVDGCQWPDESCQQSAGPSRACGAACSSCSCGARADHDAAGSRIRLRSAYAAAFGRNRSTVRAINAATSATFGPMRNSGPATTTESLRSLIGSGIAAPARSRL